MTALPGISIFLIAILVYANTWANEFAFDDIQIIADQLDKFSLGMIPKMFFKSYWSPASGIYRPLTMASFAVNRIFLGTSPTGFHWVNILLHAVNSLLIFGLLNKLLGLGRKNIAWVAALIFTVLPIHTEPVAALVGRAEILAMIFAILFWRGHLEGKTGKAALWLTSALFSKESAIMILPLAWLWDQSIKHIQGPQMENFSPGDTRRPMLEFPPSPIPEPRTPHTLLSFWPYMAVVSIWFGFRWLALGRLGIDPDYQYFAGSHFITRILTMSHFSIARYLRPTITGLNLCADFSRWCIPDILPSNPAGWLCLIFWMIFISIGLFLILSKIAIRVGFWLLWPLIAMIPTSNIFILITPIGAERFLYLPSLGFCVLAALAIDAGQTRIKPLMILIPLLLYYGALAVNRNADWKNQKTLFEDTVRKAPKNFLAHNLLGVALSKEGRLDAGIQELHAALKLAPKNQNVLANLATAYNQKGDLAAAGATLEEWIASAPENPRPRRLLESLLRPGP
ncbi:MAG: tetratricopeptide repeat protein [Elusimicrobia bacterium]|nr:tetratricopeptide repeat protein [Elusimicrobiota bacterium]